ncbi:MAG: multidrug effflux MFS transporter [Opitutaceae bacterium]|jgi:DHA1 family bicyclomycin/chloramphenicol resistance-like MFS transporter|nr:multidrug effflux MFS transporter [Opitutaceae bacterium]
MVANTDIVRDAPPAGTGARYYRLILLLALLAAFGPLAIDMYLPALPQIARDLRASESAAQFSLSVFFIAVALSQMIYGPLSDRFGRRRPLLCGLALFALASAGCARAGTAGGLIGWRVAMALGGAAGMVLSRAVVRDRFSGREAASAFSLLMIVMGAAPILAPIAGAHILPLGGWRGIFWVLLAVGVAAWLAVMFGLPESLPAERRSRLGVLSAVAGYWRLLGERRFLGYALVLGFNAGALFTYITCSPHVFIGLNGVSPAGFSAFFGLNALGMLGAAALNRKLLHNHAPGRILGGVLVVVLLAGLALAVCAWTGLGGFPAIVALLFLTLASGGMVGPNALALALEPFGRAAGSAAALLGTLQFGMGGLAGALAGCFGTESAAPMGVTLAVCAAAACASLRLASGRARQRMTPATAKDAE